MRCPRCGVDLELSLIPTKREETQQPTVSGEGSLLPSERTKDFTLKGVRYTLSVQDILQSAAALQVRETITRYYVELPDQEGEMRQFPIKQVVRKALETGSPDTFHPEEEGFHSQLASNILTGLGFTVKRRY